MRIALGSDHAAFALKGIVADHVRALGHEVLDVGTHSEDSCDYPVYGEAAGRAVADGRADLAIVICGSGVGIGIAANKVPGVRCVICSEPYSAAMGRRHNNANALAFGARVVGQDVALSLVDAFLGASFEGGRHQRRVDLLTDIDARHA